LLERVLRAVPEGEGADELDLVVGTHLALLDQPEFRDPERIRGLLLALEEKERLVDVVGRMLETGGPQVVFGGDLAEPALAHLAVVPASPRGRGGSVGGSAPPWTTPGDPAGLRLATAHEVRDA
jgi:heat-inducible transcriptional repressor